MSVPSQHLPYCLARLMLALHVFWTMWPSMYSFCLYTPDDMGKSLRGGLLYLSARTTHSAKCVAVVAMLALTMPHCFTRSQTVCPMPVALLTS